MTYCLAIVRFPKIVTHLKEFWLSFFYSFNLLEYHLVQQRMPAVYMSVGILRWVAETIAIYLEMGFMGRSVYTTLPPKHNRNHWKKFLQTFISGRKAPPCKNCRNKAEMKKHKKMIPMECWRNKLKWEKTTLHPLHRTNAVYIVFFSFFSAIIP